MEIPSGPLQFKSRHEPRPLTEEQEAALTFAAAGLTGDGLGELSYGSGEGGNIITSLRGRTIASGDGIQSVSLAVLNDEGTHLIRRSRDFDEATRRDIIHQGNAGKTLNVFRKLKYRISDQRITPSTDPIENININRWAAQAKGSTYFLPINDLTLLYINGLLEIFNESTGVFAVDERANYLPAGLKKFAASRGGHLEDDPRKGKMVTIRHIETLVSEFVAIEQGMMLQNLALMTDSLGLGGHPNFANHEFAWFLALGFRMGSLPASRYLGCSFPIRTALRLMGKDPDVPYPLGLEREGETLLKSYCPPYFQSMDDAVQAVVDLKFQAGEGFLPVRWNESLKESQSAALSVAPFQIGQSRRPRPTAVTFGSDTVDFPPTLPHSAQSWDFKSFTLGPEFYDQFYHPDALTPTHRSTSQRGIGPRTNI